MTGSQHAGIDFNWLVENLEVGEVPQLVDNEIAGSQKTLVLGPKASFAAESYILGLFQLYPTVYFHKATRSAECLFSELLIKIFQLSIDGSYSEIGLPKNHPLVAFANNPNDLELFLSLDDTVIWGALSLVSDGGNQFLSDTSTRLLNRDLYKSHDARKQFVETSFQRFPKEDSEDAERQAEEKRKKFVTRAQAELKKSLEEHWQSNPEDRECILLDEGERGCYSKFSDTKGPQNQIHIRTGNAGAELSDIVDTSPIFKTPPKFYFFRVYTPSKNLGDKTADIVRELIKNAEEKSNVE